MVQNRHHLRANFCVPASKREGERDTAGSPRLELHWQREEVDLYAVGRNQLFEGWCVGILPQAYSLEITTFGEIRREDIGRH